MKTRCEDAVRRCGENAVKTCALWYAEDFFYECWSFCMGSVSPDREIRHRPYPSVYPREHTCSFVPNASTARHTPPFDGTICENVHQRKVSKCKCKVVRYLSSSSKVISRSKVSR